VEIVDYLSIARRRRWVLILVPLLSLVAALGYVFLKPANYSATATVVSPSLVGTSYSQFSGPQSISQFVSAMSASAIDPAVVSKTSKDTQVSADDLTDGATIGQVGASSNVTVTFSSPEEDVPPRVAKSLATNALTNLFSAQGGVTDRQVQTAKDSLDAANKALSDYVTKTGVGDPSLAYQSALSHLANLQQAQAAYAATGESAAASGMTPYIDAAQKRVNDLGATLADYEALLTARATATSSYQAEVSEQRKVRAQTAAAADPGVIQTGPAVSDKSTGSMLKLVVPVFGASILMAIMLVALLEFMSALGRQRGRAKHDATRSEDPAQHSLEDDAVHEKVLAKSPR
jgi:uncharacterized protein involved in exopolysaccharide biosynthesis